MDFREAQKLLLGKIKLNDVEYVNISEAFNRILAEDLVSNKNVPDFNRSPLDGYCFNYADTFPLVQIV